MTRTVHIVVCFFLVSSAWSQYPPEVSKSVDSLKLLLSSAKSDTTKLGLLRQWDDLVRTFSAEEDSILNKRTLVLAEKALLKTKINSREKFLFHQAAGCAFKFLASHECAKGRIGQATEFYDSARFHYELANDENGLASVYTFMCNMQTNTGDLEQALQSGKMALRISRNSKDDLGICKALNAIGKVYAYRGEFDLSLRYLERAALRCGKTGDSYEMGTSHNSLGNVYLYEGNTPLAMENYTKALGIFELSGRRRNAIGLRVNVGSVHVQQGNYAKAIECYNKVLEVAQEGVPADLALAYLGMGSAYGGMGKYDSSIIFLKQSAAISKENGLLGEYCTAVTNLGTTYSSLSMHDSAFYCFKETLKINNQIGDKRGASASLSGIAIYYINVQKLDSAKIFIDEVRKMAQEMGSRAEIAEASKLEYLVYKGLENPRRALQSYKEHITLQRELFNEENQRKILENEFQFDYDMKHAKDSISNAYKSAEAEKIQSEKIRASDAEIARKKIQQGFLIGGLIFVFVFAVVIMNRFKLARHQKKTIELQHYKLEGKNKEIFDSINYAKRIQDAILPPMSLFRRIWPEGFILYKPKDIVAGDFYWLEETDDSIFFAVADCTGHGVPGAMVSVVCHNALTRSVNEYALKSPGEILDKTREIVIETFEASDNEVKDGMDISLICFSKWNNEIHFSGANNDLYILRSGTIDVLKCNKQPVGKFSHYEKFTTTLVPVKKGDFIYLFSDGFYDQFGGEKGKKMKSVNFRKILSELTDVPMNRQMDTLENEFAKWRGDFEQIDDICVVGIKV